MAGKSAESVPRPTKEGRGDRANPHTAELSHTEIGSQLSLVISREPYRKLLSFGKFLAPITNYWLFRDGLGLSFRPNLAYTKLTRRRDAAVKVLGESH